MIIRKKKKKFNKAPIINVDLLRPSKQPIITSSGFGVDIDSLGLKIY